MLGQNLYVSVVCTAGVKSKAETQAILNRLAPFINMRTGGMPSRTWFYPALDGCGGLGYTLTQPICESFEAAIVPGCLWADVWVEADLDHTFWVIASCRPFDHQKVVNWFAETVGAVLDHNCTQVQGGSRVSSRLQADLDNWHPPGASAQA